MSGKSSSLYIFLLLPVFLFLSCETTKVEEEGVAVNAPASEKQVAIDLDQIKEKDTLTAITSYSNTSYFIYRGQPMGYEYELLNLLADHLGLELEIKIARDLDKLAEMLYKGEGDIIAHGLTITKERKKHLDFTDFHTLTRQVLVQKKPDNWRSMTLDDIDDLLIRDPVELIGQKVHVRKNSSYYQRLQNLSEEIGGDINVVEASGNHTTGDLIKMVADGEIKYTIADQHIARAFKAYDPHLDIKTPISFNQRIAWAVRKTSPKLKKAINEWLSEMKKSVDYYVIYNKYFKNSRAFRQRVTSKYFSRTGGGISPFDEQFKKYAADINWDWRLLASMAYQESRFKPETESWAGAKGLMQLMPSTGEQFGAVNLLDPEQNIKAGTGYIKYLQDFWKDIPDSSEQAKFILASYNVGEGHVSDARRLCEKFGKNPDKWEDVGEYLLLKSDPEYFKDEVVKYGYCRGHEPYNYVHEVLRRYDQYVRVINTGPYIQEN